MNASPSNHIARIALRGTVWLAVGNYANQLIGFVALWILRRWLDPSLFGIFDLAAFWVALANIRSKFGISYAAIRHPGPNNALFGTIVGIEIALTLANIGMALAAIYAAASYYSYPTLMIPAALVMIGADIFISVGNVFSIALERELLVRRSQIASLGSSLIGYTLGIILAAFDHGFAGLFIIGLAQSAFSTIFVAIACWRHLRGIFQQRWHFDRHIAKSLLKDGLATGLSLALLGTIGGQFDNFLNATYIGAAAQGYYGNAFKIANWPGLILGMVISRIGYNVMARVRHDPDRLAHTVRLSLWLLCVLGMPMTLSISLGASDIIAMLYPDGKWALSAEYLRPLAIIGLGNVFMNVGYWLAVALGARRFMGLLAVAPSVCVIGAGLILVRVLGVSGTVIAVGLSSAISFVLSMTYIARSVKLNIFQVFLGPAIACFAAAAAHQALATTLAHSIAVVPQGIRFITGATFIFAIFWTTLVIVRRRESVELLRYLLQTWRRRREPS